jgi:hypothetical protein
MNQITKGMLMPTAKYHPLSIAKSFSDHLLSSCLEHDILVGKVCGRITQRNVDVVIIILFLYWSSNFSLFKILIIAVSIT